jgi:hypothetical protein
MAPLSVDAPSTSMKRGPRPNAVAAVEVAGGATAEIAAAAAAVVADGATGTSEPLQEIYPNRIRQPAGQQARFIHYDNAAQSALAAERRRALFTDRTGACLASCAATLTLKPFPFPM